MMMIIKYSYEEHRVLEKLSVAQLLRKFPSLLEPKSSLPYSDEPATDHSSESERSYFFGGILMLIYPKYPKWSPPFRVSY
jgi:hypothetical protein